MFKSSLSVFLLLILHISHAQYQDTSIVLETLNKTDLVTFEKQKDQTKFSLDRMGENPNEMIQNHYTITKEEIFRYDCVTLVDVLKVIPGFRISQPGTAQLGELFAVDGLIGNINMTVMINGFPVNPGGLPGIPIGTQLPIKQAERIEVIIGPSIMYGTASLGGVINIVIAEVERPVEVNSSVSLGDNGLRTINALMSRKIGKGKNILTYSLYGSSTSRNITPKDLDTSQFYVSNEIINNPRYSKSADSENMPDFAKLPKSSSLIGANLRFRGLTITGAFMTRKAHSAIGTSPDKVSYSDRSTIIAERSNFIGADYKFNLFKSFSMGLKASFLFYEMDENSTYIGIDHSLSNGRNFLYARSAGFNFEPTLIYKRKKLNVLVGGQFTPEEVVNTQNFMDQPYNVNFYTRVENGDTWNYEIENSRDSTSAINAISEGRQKRSLTATGFAKVLYKIGKITALAGVQYQKTNNSSGLLNFNVGLNYRISEKFDLKGSHTQLSQLPNHYFNINNFSGVYTPTSINDVIYTQQTIELRPEILVKTELTFNYYPREKTRFTARLFRQSLTDGLTTKIIESEDPSENPDANYFIGYTNNSGKSILSGLQLTAFTRGNYGSSSLDLLIRVGEENIDNIGVIDSYRNIPGFSLYYTASSNFNGSRNESGLSFRFESGFIDHVRLVDGETFSPRTIRSFNLDWSHNISFGKNLYLKIKIENLFKTKNHGVHYNWLNTNTLDYVPQIERVFSFGLKYRLN